MFVIRLDQGDYFQRRGGWDWGRSGPHAATKFDTRQEAEDCIEQHGLESYGARVEEYDP